MKNSNSKTFVAVGIGAALFFVLGRFVAIPSPVPNTNISLQYAVLGLLAAMYGPVAGALIGFIGHALIDLSWGGIPWWSWVIASAFTGVVVGLFAKKLNVQEGDFNKRKVATFAIANSSYISWTDVYMLSFLCCALCVYVTAKYRFGFLGGAPILFAGLGLYQSYLETAIVLFLLVLIRMTLEKQPLRDVILFGLKALFVLLTALLLYAAVYSLSLRLTGIQAQSAYNGLASVGKYDDLGSMLRLLGETYLYPFQYLFRPESHL